MNCKGGRRNPAADRIVALRIWLHRKLDQLYTEMSDPAFTGEMLIKLSAKNGIPGQPRTGLEEYGAGEL